MNSTWSALLWKEWREQWLLLAVFSVALVAPPLVVSLWSEYAFFGAASGW